MGEQEVSAHNVKTVLTLAALTFALGCATKKTVQPIQGPALAKYRLSDCKPLPGYEPGLDSETFSTTKRGFIAA